MPAAGGRSMGRARGSVQTSDSVGQLKPETVSLVLKPFRIITRYLYTSPHIGDHIHTHTHGTPALVHVHIHAYTFK
jgi:hypothetical protein